MTKENKEHFIDAKLSGKEREKVRINFHRFLKRHKEPEYKFSLKKG